MVYKIVTTKRFDKDYANFTEEEKNWTVKIDDNSSVAVDNMIDRLAINDLQNSTYDDKLNMSAYTKPFIAKIEFDIDNEGQSNNEGKIEYEEEVKEIRNESNNLKDQEISVNIKNEETTDGKED